MLGTAEEERERWSSLLPLPPDQVGLISGTTWSNLGPTKANNLINGSTTLHVSDSGRIDAQGWWRPSAIPAQTRLDVVVDVKEAGAFLSRFGWPDAVKAAPTRIEGEVSWAGSPGDFDYASLAGTFTLHSGAGQFTKLDPGVGRLLGVLSLQALPRRISLDFRDVFSEGFAFDNVSGQVRMQSGVMHTDDFRLVGPAAAVNIAGDVDLAKETQQLKVRVQPSNPQPTADAPHVGGNTEIKAPFTRYVVEYAISVEDLMLKVTRDGVRHGNVEAMLTAYDFEGKPLNFVARKFAIDLEPNVYEEAKTIGLQLSQEIDVPQEDFYLRTGIYDANSARAGTLGIPLAPSSPTAVPAKQ